jgi:hypothetical protein
MREKKFMKFLEVCNVSFKTDEPNRLGITISIVYNNVFELTISDLCQLPHEWADVLNS